MPKSKETKRPLVMKFAGGLIKHLGLQMYSGPVSAIAELVANAWDAMTTEVKITLPVGKPLSASDTIMVEDNGHGMTYDETIDKYLVVGLDRRKKEGDLTQPYGGLKRRKLMSRKGIGKLAGFGIATIMEVRTVKGGVITHFRMDFDKMTEGDAYVRNYEPEELADSGTLTKERPGTRITLKNLKVSKPVDGAAFATSMARRFAILSNANFSVYLNGSRIKKGEMPFQFRYPKKRGSWQEEKVPGAGKVRWWAGFTEKPIGEDEARGIVVFARGKLVQAPWFFDLSGGAFGQHGMQYMTGEMEADFLDATEGEDLVATDRATVLWDDNAAAAVLKEWGRAKVKELLKSWAEGRVQKKRMRPEIKKYLAYGERLPDREREIYNNYIQKITSIPQMDDEGTLDELAKFGYAALTNKHVLDMIKQINAASPQDSAKIGEILAEWDIVEAISAAQQVKGRVEIIRKFEQMIKNGVPEKPDMQEYVKEHAWLLDPAWAPYQHEKSLDTLLEKQFGVKKTKGKAGKKRVDYFCLAAANQSQIIELKRPGVKVGMKELQQIQNYVMFLREETKKTTQPELKMDHVGGMLIYSDIGSGQGIGTMIDSLAKDGIYVMRWGDVLRRTETLHKDFLNAVKGRAPSDDPRITGLEEVNGKIKPKKSAKKKRR